MQVRHAAPPRVFVAVAACLAVLGLALLVGYQAISPEWVERSNVGPGLELAQDGWRGAAGTILTYNIPVMLLLYSGVATLGITSVVSLFGIGAFVGATFRIGVEVGGASAVLEAVGPYILFEVAACVVAAIAGTVPVVLALTRTAEQDGVSRARIYTDALPLSLRLLGVAILLVLLAAGVEATVVLSRA